MGFVARKSAYYRGPETLQAVPKREPRPNRRRAGFSGTREVSYSDLITETPPCDGSGERYAMQPTYGTHRVKNPGLEDGVWITDARTGLRYRNPVIERTPTSRVSKSFRGDLQLGKVAMPRGPRSAFEPPPDLSAAASAFQLNN
jgi:hypothetical protein